MKQTGCILVCFLCMAVHATTEQVICTVKVVDSGGKDVVGAKVAAYEMVSNQAGNISLRSLGKVITQADGRLLFETTRSANKSIGAIIVATKKDLALGWANWDMYSDVETAIGLGEPTKIAGDVTDTTGRPIAGAEVRAVLFKKKTPEKGKTKWLPGIEPLEVLAVRTDNNGRFELNNIPANVDVDFLVTSAKRATVYTYLSGFGSQFSAGQTDIRVVQPAEARIEGRVIDRNTGKGIAGRSLAVVPHFSPAFFHRFLCVTKEDGSFSMGGLLTGEYLIRGDLPRRDVLAVAGKVTGEVIIECPGVVQGRVTGPDGSPIANAEVQIRGKEKPGEGATLNHNTETNEDGYYRYTQIDRPYEVGFLWGQDLLNGESQRVQYVGLHQLFKGSQTVNFQFEDFPTGSAGLRGQVVDQYDGIVKDFRIDIRNKVDWKDYSKDRHQYVYQLSLSTTDGRFKLSNLPAGLFQRISIHPKEHDKYESYSTEFELIKGRITDVIGKAVKKSVVKKTAYYGRIVFEGGMATVLDFQPWPGAKITVHGFAVDSDGYFTAYLTEKEYEQITSGRVEMEIFMPSYEDENVSYPVGKFPGKLLSTDKNKAESIGVTRPRYPQKPDMINLKNAPPLAGKLLRGLKDLKPAIETGIINDKMVLVCFWDMQQRPSRHCVRKLAKQAEDLAKKGIVVVGVHTSVADETALKEWLVENKIDFPVGSIEGDVDARLYKWGVRGQPWLLLTDNEHVVRVEGFGVGELVEQIQLITQK